MDPHEEKSATAQDGDSPKEKVSPEFFLKQLHGDPSQGECRDTILLVEPDDGVRMVCIRILSQIFPGYQVEAIDCDSKAIERIRGEGAKRVAMIIDLDDEGAATLSLLRGDAEGHLVSSSSDKDPSFLRVPIVLIPKPSFGDENLFKTFVEEGAVDGLLEKPFGREAFAEVLTIAIQKRLGIFQDIEASSRPSVISDFIEHASSLIPYWKKALLGLSFAPDEGEEVEAESKGEDIKTVSDSLIGLESVLTQLQELGPKLDDSSLRRLAHDMNNKITPAFVFIGIMLEEEDCGLNEQDRAILNQLKNQIFSLINYIQAIMSAYKNGPITWSAIKAGKIPIMPKGQELNLPKGCRVCIVDDDPAVQSACARLIRYAGGVSISATNRDLLEKICSDEGSEIDVVLLDHNLEEIKGYELISLIRDKWPNALIIAHTSDANALNGDPSNPYRAAHVEVVGKLDTRAISGIVRRKLGATETPPAM